MFTRQLKDFPRICVHNQETISSEGIFLHCKFIDDGNIDDLWTSCLEPMTEHCVTGVPVWWSALMPLPGPTEGLYDRAIVAAAAVYR